MNNNQTFFSVVVPAYNRADLLARALESLATQTYQHFEVLVVDDCSAEDIAKTVAKFCSKKFKYYRLPQNTGGAGARNFGICKAIGEYIAFLDSDDYWYDQKLELTLAYLELKNFNVECIVTGVDIKKQDGLFVRKLNNRDPRTTIFDSIILDGFVVQTSSIMLKSDVAKETLFTESLKKHQDLDLYVKLDNKNIRCHYIKEALCVWDISHDMPSISRTSMLSNSINWIISVQHIISNKSFCKFASKFIIGNSESASVAIKSFKLLSQNVPNLSTLVFLIDSLSWWIIYKVVKLLK